MPKVIVSGRGGSGKSTLVALLAGKLGEQGTKALVVDADESNLSLDMMLNVPAPKMTLLDYLGGKPAVRDKLLAAIRGGNGEGLSLFSESMSFANLPSQCVSWKDGVGLVRVGKIEHSNEGCACPMGAIARNFLKQLQVDEGQWLLVDTEAGVEHFGRGVLDGVEIVLMMVDPSHESVVLAEKAKLLAGEAGKGFLAVLNRSDETTEPLLSRQLEERGIPIAGALSFSSQIARSNLAGDPVVAGAISDEVAGLIEGVGRLAGCLNSGNIQNIGGK